MHASNDTPGHIWTRNTGIFFCWVAPRCRHPFFVVLVDTHDTTSLHDCLDFVHSFFRRHRFLQPCFHSPHAARRRCEKAVRRTTCFGSAFCVVLCVSSGVPEARISISDLRPPARSGSLADPGRLSACFFARAWSWRGVVCHMVAVHPDQGGSFCLKTRAEDFFGFDFF